MAAQLTTTKEPSLNNVENKTEEEENPDDKDKDLTNSFAISSDLSDMQFETRDKNWHIFAIPPTKEEDPDDLIELLDIPHTAYLYKWLLDSLKECEEFPFAKEYLKNIWPIILSRTKENKDDSFDIEALAKFDIDKTPSCDEIISALNKEALEELKDAGVERLTSVAVKDKEINGKTIKVIVINPSTKQARTIKMSLYTFETVAGNKLNNSITRTMNKPESKTEKFDVQSTSLRRRINSAELPALEHFSLSRFIASEFFDISTASYDDIVSGKIKEPVDIKYTISDNFSSVQQMTLQNFEEGIENNDATKAGYEKALEEFIQEKTKMLSSNPGLKSIEDKYNDVTSDYLELRFKRMQCEILNERLDALVDFENCRNEHLEVKSTVYTEKYETGVKDMEELTVKIDAIVEKFAALLRQYEKEPENSFLYTLKNINDYTVLVKSFENLKTYMLKDISVVKEEMRANLTSPIEYEVQDSEPDKEKDSELDKEKVRDTGKGFEPDKAKGPKPGVTPSTDREIEKAKKHEPKHGHTKPSTTPALPETSSKSSKVPDKADDSSGSNLGLILGISGGCVALLLIVVIIVVLVKKKSSYRN